MIEFTTFQAVSFALAFSFFVFIVVASLKAFVRRVLR